MSPTILIIDDEPAIGIIVSEMLSSAGYEAEYCHDTDSARKMLAQKKFFAVISDIHMEGMSGIDFLENIKGTLPTIPPFIFISGNSDPKVVERAAMLGSIDVLQKPFTNDQIIQAIKRIGLGSDDRIEEFMEIVRRVSGINFGSEKRPLVETRLLRRYRQLSLGSLNEYYQYFQKHRDEEIKELVSLMTTHTTQFFREYAHFDYLVDEFFPEFIKTKQRELNIWSAASSTGQEAYSLAICWFEFLRKVRLDPQDAPQLKIVGTDIDFKVIEEARRGIYAKSAIESLNSNVVSRYFDFGTGAISNQIKVKDFVHRCVAFAQLNLLEFQSFKGGFDIVFLRNLLIYFDPKSMKKIMDNITRCLNPSGLVFIGHSESLSGLGLHYKTIGNSIYQSMIGQPSKIVPTSNTEEVQKKTRVFIIDDSSTIRAMLKKIFEKDASFVVVGEAENPKKIKTPLTKAIADVVTLDIHMPEQDGISYLKSIQWNSHPPVVMISSISYEDGTDYLNSLEYGATDYIEKPNANNLSVESERIVRVVKSAARRSANKRQKPINPREFKGLAPVYSGSPTGKNLILIGASTGGVEALRTVLLGFPTKCPPVLIVQHIPGAFSKALADRLSQICPIKVMEATHGTLVSQNCAYIAPGGHQMGVLLDSANRLVIDISDADPVNRHKPSVDYLFGSVAKIAYGWNIAAAILTGMGADGAAQLRTLYDKGAHTVAQDEESSVVFGMPKAAIEAGGVQEVVPLTSIAYHLFKAFKKAAA